MDIAGRDKDIGDHIQLTIYGDMIKVEEPLGLAVSHHETAFGIGGANPGLLGIIDGLLFGLQGLLVMILPVFFHRFVQFFDVGPGSISSLS